MDGIELKKILEEVKSGDVPVAEAIERLRTLPYDDIGCAKLDLHRAIRTGFPEVVFCQGKTCEQSIEIVKRLVRHHAKVLATRVAPDVAGKIAAAVEGCTYHEIARILVVERPPKAEKQDNGKYVMVLCAGTADIPVAEEAAVTAESMGSRVERSYDIGVAGLHRLLDQRERIMQANVLIVVAGMEGALPSVVGGDGLLPRDRRADERRLRGKLRWAVRTAGDAQLLRGRRRRNEYRQRLRGRILRTPGESMKIAYFDCFAGISGDMTLGALIGVGADPERLREGLAGLGVGGYRIEVGKRMTGPIEATDVRVLLDDCHHHHHRRLHDILEMIRGANLSDRAKQMAESIFRRLAEAEAKVHGHSPEKVHFHEVGAVDAIIDIVGTAISLEMLDWPKVIASPMPTFHGYAKGSHGVFPLPAPATAEILRGIPWRKLDIEGELVTPTGAAIIREIAAGFGPLPAMTVESIGYGAGKSDFGIPNALRIMIGEGTALSVSPAESVTVIESNIDDLNPQFYETAMERLFAAGALDVFLTPIQMKKNRPGTLLSVICDPDRAQTMADTVLAETTTFGVRISRWERLCLDRRWEEVVTGFGVIRIKVGERDGRVITATPEYEDCKRAAAEHKVAVRHVHESALDIYRAGKKDFL
jgi:hypothetical protein